MNSLHRWCSSTRSINKTYYPKKTQRNFIKFIPHEITRELAARRFIEEDKKRFFSPSSEKLKTYEMTELADNPLKKVLLPIFAVKAEIESTSYIAEYGISRTRLRIVNGKPETEYYTDWYPISGKIGSVQYKPDLPDMFIYGGLTWDAATVESSLTQFKILNRLQDFSADKIDFETFVDPFAKRSSLASEEAKERLHEKELARIRHDIGGKISHVLINVKHCDTTYKSLNLSNLLLPAYILQYPHQPPRILPGVKEKLSIIGPKPISTTKVFSTALVVCGLFALCIPELTAFATLTAALAPSLLIGIGVQNKLFIQDYFQQRRLKNFQEKNDRLFEDDEDVERRKITDGMFECVNVSEKYFFSRKEKNDDLLKMHFENIGLDSNTRPETLTVEAIDRAWREKMLKIHPDTHKGDEYNQMTIAANTSRAYLHQLIEKNKGAKVA